MSAQCRADLCRHLTRSPDHVSVAVPQYLPSTQHHLVVPSKIAERLLHRMGLAPVQLHHGGEIAVPDIAIAAGAVMSFRLVPSSTWQTVGSFHVTGVPKFQR